jgi:hypothetical protein
MGILPFIIIATSLWVLFDARSIGFKRGQVKGLFSMGPWGWFFGSLLLWIVCFPAYLLKRGELKQLTPIKRKDDNSLEQLEKLGQLKEKGIITNKEFEAKKSEILSA